MLLTLLDWNRPVEWSLCLYKVMSDCILCIGLCIKLGPMKILVGELGIFIRSGYVPLLVSSCCSFFKEEEEAKLD